MAIWVEHESLKVRGKRRGVFLKVCALAVGCILLKALVDTTIASQLRENPYQILYAKLSDHSELHEKVLSHYAACRRNEGTWQTHEVIAHDCLSVTMRMLDAQKLPRDQLFAIEMDIRNGEWAIADRKLNAQSF